MIVQYSIFNVRNLMFNFQISYAIGESALHLQSIALGVIVKLCIYIRYMQYFACIFPEQVNMVIKI